uniref:RING-Gid-type domain-containing protein n=1 Tax=Caenorhabditis tropicalis TaxID=1561998 RepID=A0A1I7TBS1_9PELO
MGAIVCPIEESRIRNPEYHAPDRYQQCAQLFVKEAYRLYGFESSSAMEQLIQMGLATQKTPCCKPDLETPLNKQKCMVCRPDMYPLAEGLPYAHVDNSRILCSMTGTVVDDDENIPFLFPSGHVFGLKAINKLRRPENKIFDPIHKQMMDESEALRLYFL